MQKTAPTTNAANQRYRNLILSISVFLLLILALLVFTFIASRTLERNTLLINTANQTANNAQAVIKDLFDLQNTYGEDPNSPHQKVVIARLTENSKTTPQLLNAMKNGGQITDAAGRTYSLSALNDSEAQKDLDEAQKQWDALAPRIDTYLKGAVDIQHDSQNDLFLASEQAKTSSLLMNDAMSSLTQEVFKDAQSVANTIRLVQILGVAIILGYFVVFVFFFVRRLRESDAQADAARRETEEIMENVSTGLFLLDKDLKIGNQFSRALAKIVGADRLAGENLTNVLRGRVSDHDLNTTRQFVDQLYNPRVKEKLVEDLNPLKKVMVRDTSGTSASRYLDFKFSRVYENKDIARILVNVSDVSDAVRLEQRLEKERAQNEMQIDMLTTVLNVEPGLIQSFISNSKQYINKMNDILRNPGSTQGELEAKINAIYREMHSLKGESSALKLQSFTALASDAETTLSGLRNQPKLTGNDFLPLTVQLDGLLNLSNMIESLGQRIGAAFSGDAANAQNKPVTATSSVQVESVAPVANVESTPAEATTAVNESENKEVNYFVQFVQDVAERQGKRVNLDTSSYADVSLPAHLDSAVKEIKMQLLKNAVVHGVEKHIVRVANGKNAKGTIILAQELVSNQLHLIIEDDGQGIKFDSIREKLVSSQKFDQAAVDAMTEEQLVMHLFDSGFSTKDNVDEDAGRGVGLDIIKARVEEHQGTVNVQSEEGKFTRFVIRLPISV
ncbi:ATP-binding protein [Acinetobacter sp. c3-l95]|uniref:ATP-binding protein n=1 Tax=Acinetobacter sp. c3-l95 TaxID=3342804 RepID=UPI0035BB0455